MKTKKFLTKDQETLHYYDSEKGKETLLLIHGFPFCLEMWSPQLSDLEKNYRVIAPNLRGMGENQSPSLFTMEMMADDVIALVNHLKISKINALGFSMGGYVLLRAQEKSPELFKSLILADTQSAPDSDEARIKRSAAIYKIKEQGLVAFAKDFLPNAMTELTIKNKPEVVEAITKVILKSKTAGAVAELIAMTGRTDTTASLSSIKIPTLIIVGEEDKITPPATAKKMHELIKKSRLEIIPQAAHMSNWENAKAFNGVLLDFLSKV